MKKWQLVVGIIISILVYGFDNCYAQAQSSRVASSGDFPWNYTVDKQGVTHTKRSYLIITSDAQIQVQSDCKKSPGEARYGQCDHTLRFVPYGKVVYLTTGEDVVLISTISGEIATIDYGCCADANTVVFYDKDIKPIGQLYTYNSPIIRAGWIFQLSSSMLAMEKNF